MAKQQQNKPDVKPPQDMEETMEGTDDVQPPATTPVSAALAAPTVVVENPIALIVAEMEKPSCGNCKFYRADPDNQTVQIGHCRRNAPGPLTVANTIKTRWPSVSPHTDWCGEWVSQPVPT